MANLKILRAVWGLQEVTQVIQDKVWRSSSGDPQFLEMTASNGDIGRDGWAGRQKVLITVSTYSDSPSKLHVSIAKEGDPFHIYYNADDSTPPFTPDTTPSHLNILGAVYGVSDVTNHVRNMIQYPSQLNFNVSNDTFGGDNWPKNKKAVVLIYKWGDGGINLLINTEGDNVGLKYRPQLNILGAVWGQNDVTSKVRDMAGVALSGTANVSTFGETWPGKVKSLSVAFQYGDETPKVLTASEGQAFAIDYTPTPNYAGTANLDVLAASWGLSDVTATVRQLVQQDKSLSFNVNNNDLRVDGWTGVSKSFMLVYKSGGPTGLLHVVAKTEGQSVSINV